MFPFSDSRAVAQWRAVYQVPFPRKPANPKHTYDWWQIRLPDPPFSERLVSYPWVPVASGSSDWHLVGSVLLYASRLVSP